MKDSKSLQSKHHAISVSTENGERVMRFGGIKQSAVSGDGSFESSQDYHGLAHIGVAIGLNVKRILLIGLGGGALAGRILRDYPQCELVVCEIDPVVARLAVDEFGLPVSPNLRIVIDDGRHFIENCAEIFDYIFVDAYFEQGMPYALVTKEAFFAYAEILSEQGALGFNFVDRTDGHALMSLVATSRPYFKGEYFFSTGNDCKNGRTNIAVFFSKDQVDESQLAARISTRAEGTISFPGFERFDEYRVRVNTNVNAEIFCDVSPNNGFIQT